MSKRPEGVRLIGTCSHCGEAVELILTKKQIKGIMKGFKASSSSQAELVAEKFIGRTTKGDLKGEFKE